MKHLATIQREFVKEAVNWDDLSQNAQKEYLKAHPKSKRRLTAKPSQDTSSLKEKLHDKEHILTDQESLDIGKSIMDTVDSTDLEGLTTLANIIIGGDNNATDDNQQDLASQIADAIENMDRKSLKDIHTQLTNQHIL